MSDCTAQPGTLPPSVLATEWIGSLVCWTSPSPGKRCAVLVANRAENEGQSSPHVRPCFPGAGGIHHANDGSRAAWWGRNGPTGGGSVNILWVDTPTAGGLGTERSLV